MHERGVCHRDIKCDNIMITKDMKLVLMDFGVSKYFRNLDTIRRGNSVSLIEPDEDDMYTETGTLCVRAPEMIEGSPYNELVDVWSAGVTLYQMLFGVNPF